MKFKIDRKFSTSEVYLMIVLSTLHVLISWWIWNDLLVRLLHVPAVNGWDIIKLWFLANTILPTRSGIGWFLVSVKDAADKKP